MKIYIILAVSVLVIATAQAQQTQVVDLLPQLQLTNIFTVTNVTTYKPESEPSLSDGIDKILSAFHQSVADSYWVVYGMKAKGLPKQWGGGIGWFNPLSKYVVTGLRVDYVDGAFWMPSGSATLQLPLKLGNYLTVTPFTYAGIGVPLSGAKFQFGSLGGVTLKGQATDNNGQATAITGLGASLDIYNGKDWHLKAVYDVENWTGFHGQQQRLGLAYSSNRQGLFGIGLNLGVIKL